MNFASGSGVTRPALRNPRQTGCAVWRATRVSVVPVKKTNVPVGGVVAVRRARAKTPRKRLRHRRVNLTRPENARSFAPEGRAFGSAQAAKVGLCAFARPALVTNPSPKRSRAPHLRRRLPTLQMSQSLWCRQLPSARTSQSTATQMDGKLPLERRRQQLPRRSVRLSLRQRSNSLPLPTLRRWQLTFPRAPWTNRPPTWLDRPQRQAKRRGRPIRLRLRCKIVVAL
jgi:hypothetical protein